MINGLKYIGFIATRTKSRRKKQIKTNIFMSEKKKSADWYVAATHYIIVTTIGVIVSFLISIVRVIMPLLAGIGLTIVSLIIGVLGLWIGVMYSAKYIKNHYIVEDKTKIINLATIYLVVFSIVFNIGYVLVGEITGVKLPGSDTAYSILSLITSAVLFYVFSKKYIKNTENTSGQIQQNVNA